MNSAFANITTITKRELSGYFSSPVAYVFIVVFLLLTSFFTFMLGGFFERGEASLNGSFFMWHPWLFMVFSPVVGMGLWAEERRRGTFELLLTFPVTAWQAIVGKFLASWLFIIIALICTFPVVLTVGYLGKPDYGTIFTAYLGTALMAGGFLAITEMTSAMTRNQIVSLIISVAVCFGLILAGFEPVTVFLQEVVGLPDSVVRVAANCTVMPHFFNMQRGVIDIRDLVFFGSLMGFPLFCTSVILRSLRGG